MSATIKKSFLVDVEITPDDMASLFVNADSAYQAAFFNRVAQMTELWTTPACFQWRYLEQDLTPEGATLLQALAEHTDGARA